MTDTGRHIPTGRSRVRHTWLCTNRTRELERLDVGPDGYGRVVTYCPQCGADDANGTDPGPDAA